MTFFSFEMKLIKFDWKNTVYPEIIYSTMYSGSYEYILM